MRHRTSLCYPGTPAHPFLPALSRWYARAVLDPRKRMFWARWLRGRPPFAAWTAARMHDALLAVAARAMDVARLEWDWEAGPELADELLSACSELGELTAECLSTSRRRSDTLLLLGVARSMMWIGGAAAALSEGAASRNELVEQTFRERFIFEAKFMQLCCRRWAFGFLRPAPARWPRRWFPAIRQDDWHLRQLRRRAHLATVL